VRRILGTALLLVGGFVLAAGWMLWTWVPDHVLRTERAVDETTQLVGNAEMASVDGLDHFRVKLTDHTITDPRATTETVSVWADASCMVVDVPGAPDCVRADDPTYRLVNASIWSFATGRENAYGVSDTDDLPKGLTPTRGLVNKFPFGTEKRDYPYWDTTLKRTVTAAYESEADFDGLNTYEFTVDVPETKVELAKGVEGTYATRQHIYVEPATGDVVQQSVYAVTKLADGSPAFITNLNFSPDQLAHSVSAAKWHLQLIHLMRRSPVPVMVLGILIMAFGLAKIRPRRGRRESW